MSPINVSVIIPAYNASATLGQTLKALLQQNCFQPYEVIVVDDGSSDTTPEIVASFPTIKYIRQENAGPASARNHGARLAQGGYLVFTDSDCVPHEDWIARLMAGMAQPQVGVVAGSYGIANSQSILARCVYKEILWRHQHMMPDFPNSFGSYNFCVKKDVFLATGSFDTGYRTASGEDNDFAYKIRARGWRIFFERKALVDHYHPVRLIKYLKEQFRHGYWRVKMYRDHPRMMKGDDYTFWKDIVEMPLVSLAVLFFFLSLYEMDTFKYEFTVIVLGFFIFEIAWAIVMTCNFFEGIFLGFVFFMRAFARLGGFSSGILSFLIFKKIKFFNNPLKH